MRTASAVSLIAFAAAGLVLAGCVDVEEAGGNETGPDDPFPPENETREPEDGIHNATEPTVNESEPTDGGFENDTDDGS